MRLAPYSAILGLALALVFGPPAALALKALEPGDALPPVSVADEKLETRPLPEFLGPKGALFVFWASWNPRSREILSYLQDLDGRYRDRGLRVVPVNADHEGLSSAQVGELARTYAGWGLAWPSYYDARLDAFAALGVITFPTTVYVGSDARITGVYPGFPAEAREALEELIQKGLGVWSPPVEPRRAEPVRYAPRNGAGQRLQMARLLLAKGQRRRAADAARQAAEQDPDFALAQAAAAVLSAEESPEPWLEKLRLRSAEDPGARESLGAALVALGRTEEARSVLEPLLSIEEPRPRGLVALALLRFRAGDVDGASRILERLKAWPVGGVPLAVDVSDYVEPSVPPEVQWSDVDPAALRLLGLAGGPPR